MKTAILYPMNIVNRTHPLTYGLLAWWLVHLQINGAGLRWTDFMRSHVSTLTGMAFPPTATSGWGSSSRVGSSGELRFDGTDDRVQPGQRSDWSFSNGGLVDTAFSLSAALYMTNIAATGGIVGKWGFSVGGPEWLWFVAGSIMYFSLYDPTGSATIGRYAVLTTGSHQDKWIYATCTYDGSKASTGIRINIDGQRADTNDSIAGTYPGMTASGQPVEIGSYNVGGNLFSGRMDDIRIYNYALTPLTVRALYEASRTGYRGQLNTIHPLFYKGVTASGASGSIAYSRIFSSAGIAHGSIAGGG